MKRFYKFLFVGAIMGAMLSCTYEPYADFPIEIPTDSVSFSATIEPIFSVQGCTACHPTTAQIDLNAGSAYASIMSGRVDLANPADSKIYTKAHPDSGHAKKYTSQQAILVLTWIEQGALDN